MTTWVTYARNGLGNHKEIKIFEVEFNTKVLGKIVPLKFIISDAGKILERQAYNFSPITGELVETKTIDNSVLAGGYTSEALGWFTEDLLLKWYADDGSLKISEVDHYPCDIRDETPPQQPRNNQVVSADTLMKVVALSR